MARMRPLYKYNGDEWIKTNISLNVDNCLFLDVGGVSNNFDLSNYSYAKVDGYLCQITDVDEEYLREHVTALLMSANCAYQENGHTLFSNVYKGKEITGVVRLTPIEYIQKDNELVPSPEDTTNPEKRSLKYIGENNDQSIYEKKVGGFLCSRDGEEYQFTGIDFSKKDSGLSGNFNLQNANQNTWPKGFGFTERKPIVLWQNFYNFDKLDDMPTYKIEEGWLYKDNVKVCWVGSDACFKIYKRQNNLTIKNNSGITGWVLKTTANDWDQKVEITGKHYIYQSEPAIGGGVRGWAGVMYAPEILIKTKVLCGKLTDKVQSNIVRHMKYPNLFEDVEEKNSYFKLKVENLFSGYHGDKDFSSVFYKADKIYQRIHHGSYSEYKISYSLDRSGVAANLDKDAPFVQVSISLAYPKFLQPTDLSFDNKILSNDQQKPTTITKDASELNYQYMCYNTPRQYNFSTLYCELSTTLNSNFPCGLTSMVSINKNRYKDYDQDKTTTQKDFEWEGGDYYRGGNVEQSFYVEEDKREYKSFSEGKFFFDADKTLNDARFVGAFFGIRTNNEDDTDRYCITLEWEEETDE